MSEHYNATHFCMSFSTSCDYMREAFDASKLVLGTKALQWPQDVHIESEEEEGYNAVVYFHPTDTKNPPHATLEQFLFVSGYVAGRHPWNYQFTVNAHSDNPRFFYDNNLDNDGGFYVDENKIQGEAVMRLNKVREIIG